MSSEMTGSTRLFEFYAWVEENKKGLAIGFVALVLVGLGAVYVRHREQQKETEANTALTQLRASTEAEGKGVPATSADYLKVVADYSGTDAADRALLLAAGALFAEGKYAEAGARFDQFLKENPDHLLAASAAQGAAAALEAEGKQDAAFEAYKNVVARYPRSAVVNEAKLSMARIYESRNQPEAALKIYDDLTAPGPAMGFNPQASTRKEALLAKHPQLVKTNAPSAGGTNIPIMIPPANQPQGTPPAAGNAPVTPAPAAAPTPPPVVVPTAPATPGEPVPAQPKAEGAAAGPGTSTPAPTPAPEPPAKP